MTLHDDDERFNSDSIPRRTRNFAIRQTLLKRGIGGMPLRDPPRTTTLRNPDSRALRNCRGVSGPSPK